MSNLVSFSVINEKVQKIFIDEGLENKGMAFTYLCLKTLFKLTDEEIVESITDGPQDGEIDAIYIDDRIIHILTFKYTDNFEFSKKNFPGSDLDQFILTVDSIINGSINEKTINDAVWDKYQEITNLSSNGRIEFKIYIVSNKLHPTNDAKIKLASKIEKYNIVEEPIYLDQEGIVSKILENKKKPINGSIKFIDQEHFEKQDGSIKTVIGAVAASEFIELIKEDEENINENAFNENIRVYKPRHRINQDIIESANSQDNYQFFYLNNGVTILCENVMYAPHTRNPHVELENFQIINGGQTSHSLFEVYKKHPEKLSTVDLLVRICETKDGSLSEKISETSNSQIPVGNRDLRSNDRIQRKLEEEFKDLGYFYERKPSQYSKESKDKVLNNELLGQLFMAYYFDMPSEAKNNKTKVFSDMYDQIFDEMIISSSKLLWLHKLYLPLLEEKKEIQRKKRKKEKVNEKEAFISRAIFHIINGVKFLFENAEKEIDSKDISSAKKKKEKEELYKTKGYDFTTEATNMIFAVVLEEMKVRGDSYTHDKFFKEINTNHIVKMYILIKLGKKENHS